MPQNIVLASIHGEIQIVEACINYIEQTLIPEETTPAEFEILQGLRQFLQGQFPSQLPWRSRDS